jgi:hypothetical protein
VEPNSRTLRSRLLSALEDDPARAIGDLNDLLAAYVARHNSTPHPALGGKTPLEVWEAMTAEAPVRPHRGTAWLDECFLNRTTRKVNKDATVRVRNVLFDVPQHLVGERVDICYEVGGDGRTWVVEGDARGERRTPVLPTDKEANGRMPRVVPRYHYDWTSTDEGGDRA